VVKYSNFQNDPTSKIILIFLQENFDQYLCCNRQLMWNQLGSLRSLKESGEESCLWHHLGRRFLYQETLREYKGEEEKFVQNMHDSCAAANWHFPLIWKDFGPEGQIQWILREETSDELWLITLFPTVSAISETYHTLTMFKNTSKYLHNQLGSIHFLDGGVGWRNWGEG